MSEIHAARREEIATAGFDPFRQLNPDAFGFPGSTGILLPASPFTYLVLAAVGDLDRGDSVVGIRQYIDLVSYVGTSTPPPPGLPDPPGPPWYPLRQTIPDPMWHAIDGGDTWILTREPKRPTARLQGPLDQDTFIFRDSDSSALVYETAALGVPVFGPLLPGYLALVAYTAPVIKGTKVLAVRDRRWPWTKQANQRIEYECEAPERWRLYVMVTQTNPLTRNRPTFTCTDNYSLPPQEGFLQQTYGAEAVYGWVAGALIIQRGNRR